MNSDEDKHNIEGIITFGRNVSPDAFSAYHGVRIFDLVHKKLYSIAPWCGIADHVFQPFDSRHVAAHDDRPSAGSAPPLDRDSSALRRISIRFRTRPI